MAWFIRMTPKLKNWRWWLCSPVLVVYALVAVIPFVVFEYICECLYSFSKFTNTANKPSPKWLSRMINWSDSNDKCKTK